MIQDLNKDLSQALGFSDQKGVLIADVNEGSPADKAGIQRGDVVLKINNETVDSTGRLRNLVAVAGSGAKISVELLRKGKRINVQVVLGEMPATMGGVAKLDNSEGILGGLTLTAITPALRDKFNITKRISHGVVVQEVAEGSPASRAGIRQGDVILEINRSAVKDVKQFESLYHKAKDKILLLVYREGNTIFLLLSK